MQHPKPLSLGEAAQLAGVHKTTIARKVRTGLIVGKTLDDGSYQINHASLARVYPAVLQLDTAEKVEDHLRQIYSAFEAIGERFGDIEDRLNRIEACQPTRILVDGLPVTRS